MTGRSTNEIWIDCGRGYRTVVDEDDGHLVDLAWHTHVSGENVYACHTYANGGAREHVFLHHHLLPKLPERDVDHIDGNSLNNRRANLRIVTHAANVANQARSIHKNVHK